LVKEGPWPTQDKRKIKREKVVETKQNNRRISKDTNFKEGGRCWGEGGRGADERSVKRINFEPIWGGR